MTINVDSREKARAIKKILAEFDKQKVDYFISKLYAGDYCNLDNPRLVIDRKQNLSEVCGNVCGNHDRFRQEMIRAKEHGIQLVILVEHGGDIKCLEDVIWWKNPRAERRVKINGVWQTVYTKATPGYVLYKILKTQVEKYNVRFEFCSKQDTGKRIIEMLREGI